MILRRPIFLNKKGVLRLKKKEPKFRCETYIDCLMLEMKNDFEFLSLTSNFDRTLRSVNFKMSFGCLRFNQKTNEFFLRISAQASKKRLNQKL